MTEETKPDSLPPGEVKDAAEAREKGYKRAFQKLLEKAFVLVNATPGFVQREGDKLKPGELAIQLCTMEGLGSDNKMGAMIVQDDGEGGCWPLAILMDPRMLKHIKPALYSTEYEELNKRIRDGVASEDLGGGDSLGDATDMAVMDMLEALDCIEPLSAWAGNQAAESSAHRLIDEKIASMTDDERSQMSRAAAKAGFIYDPPTQETEDE